MEELRVPKRSVRVEIRFAGGASSDVEVYLADLGNGRERLSDLLEGQAEFLPVNPTPGAAMALLRRDSIAVAWVAPEIELAGTEDELDPTEVPIEVLLADGSTITGQVRYAMEPERSRLLDFLNGPARYFAVWSAGRVALVCKQHVARVVPGADR